MESGEIQSVALRQTSRVVAMTMESGEIQNVALRQTSRVVAMHNSLVG
jgi:hypothetical protein